MKYYIKSKDELTLLRLNKAWGEKKQKSRKIDQIKQLFGYLKNESNSYKIDEQTSRDLNLDDVFAVVDRTLTTPGENVLYNFLRSPLYDEKNIEKRDKLISIFQTNKPDRDKILLELHKLGCDDENRTVEFLWGDIRQQSSLRYVFTILHYIAIASLFTIPFLGEQSVFYMIPIFLVNSLIHFGYKKYYSHLIPALKYLCKILNTTNSIKVLEIESLNDYNKKLSELSVRTKKLHKIIRLLDIEIPIDIFNVAFDYMNMFFLRELRSYYSSIEEIDKNIVHLRDIYTILGEIDSFQSIASYRDGQKSYSIPIFKQYTDTNEFYIKGNDLVHPMLIDPVSNSITISNRGILITGSNMAGKSTFLRTIGINALFAQTISTSLSTKYEGVIVNIISSINQADDITKGKSFYFSESERLLNIINTSKNEIPTLCIIDELLAGTNSFERLIASEVILKYLINQNAIVIVATHDITLANNLSSVYSCFHFTDKVDENGMNFDYILKEGISSTSNAIRLLEYLKYPEEIYTTAYGKAQSL